MILYNLTSILEDFFASLRFLLIKPLFKASGKKIRIRTYEKLIGLKYISIGSNTILGEHIFLTAWNRINNITPFLTIGQNCRFGAMNHISCCNRIEIGDNLLTGKWISIVDNSHGTTNYEDLQIDPSQRVITSKGPIVIGNNVWIGDKATILAGITIGNGSVIAANTVVTKDVPANSIAYGNPMIIKSKVKQ